MEAKSKNPCFELIDIRANPIGNSLTSSISLLKEPRKETARNNSARLIFFNTPFEIFDSTPELEKYLDHGKLTWEGGKWPFCDSSSVLNRGLSLWGKKILIHRLPKDRISIEELQGAAVLEFLDQFLLRQGMKQFRFFTVLYFRNGRFYYVVLNRSYHVVSSSGEFLNWSKTYDTLEQIEKNLPVVLMNLPEGMELPGIQEFRGRIVTPSCFQRKDLDQGFEHSLEKLLKAEPTYFPWSASWLPFLSKMSIALCLFVFLVKLSTPPSQTLDYLVTPEEERKFKDEPTKLPLRAEQRETKAPESLSKALSTLSLELESMQKLLGSPMQTEMNAKQEEIKSISDEEFKVRVARRERSYPVESDMDVPLIVVPPVKLKLRFLSKELKFNCAGFQFDGQKLRLCEGDSILGYKLEKLMNEQAYFQHSKNPELRKRIQFSSQSEGENSDLFFYPLPGVENGSYLKNLDLSLKDWTELMQIELNMGSPGVKNPSRSVKTYEKQGTEKGEKNG